MSKKSIPPEAARLKENYTYLTRIEQTSLGLSDDDDSEKAYVALKYFQHSYECFSEWTREELKAFSDFIHKMRQVNWITIFKSGGGAGRKTGFGYTPHSDRSRLPNRGAVLKEISPEIQVFELRVTEKARVHGFRVKSAFFLVWLDRNHQIYPQ